MIISISGYAGSGKDTVGKIIQYLNMYNSNPTQSYDSWLKWYNKFSAIETESIIRWQIKKWATALRKVAAILLGMDEAFLYTDEFKNMVLPECWWYYQQLKRSPNDVFAPERMIPYLSLNKEQADLLVSNSNVRLNKMTGREFLQKLGTDAIRNGLHENTWVNALMSEYKDGNNPFNFKKDENSPHPLEEVWPNWIITDTRFPNELAAVKERGGITIRVNRDIPCNICKLTKAERRGSLCKEITCPNGLPNRGLHPSETSLDHITDWDYVIQNNGTIEKLVEKLKPIIIKISNNGTDSTARQSTCELH